MTLWLAATVLLTNGTPATARIKYPSGEDRLALGAGCAARMRKGGTMIVST